MVWFLFNLLCIYLIPAEFRQFIPEIPEHCRTTKYCEDVPNYPQDHVDNIVHNLDHERYGLTDDVLLSDITSSAAQKEYSLCKTLNKRILYPKAAQNRHGDWQFIINSHKDQTIEVEICAPEAVDKPCGNDVPVTFKPGYSSRCKQKYIYRYMLGLDERGNVTEITTEMPSCCACVFSRFEHSTINF